MKSYTIARLGVKRMARRAAPVGMRQTLADLGVSEEHLDAGLPCRRGLKARLAHLRRVEAARGLPYITWVIADLASSLEIKPAAAWDGLRRGSYSRRLIAASLRRIAATGLGELRPRELPALLSNIAYALPISRDHLRSLPTNNGMLSREAAARMLNGLS